MVKKIEVVETRRYIYEPNITDPGSVYAEYDADNIEAAMALDKKDVERDDVSVDDLGEGYYELVKREWRIIDEP